MRKPFYVFKDETSTGLDEVPVNGIIYIEEYDSGVETYPLMLQLTSITSITQTSTIADLVTTGIVGGFSNIHGDFMDLGPSQEASIRYNSTDDSIDFIFNEV